MSGVVDVILAVGKERNAIVERMRTALELNNDKEVLALARELCGVSDEKCHPAHSRIN